MYVYMDIHVYVCSCVSMHMCLYMYALSLSLCINVYIQSGANNVVLADEVWRERVGGQRVGKGLRGGLWSDNRRDNQGTLLDLLNEKKQKNVLEGGGGKGD